MLIGSTNKTWRASSWIISFLLAAPILVMAFIGLDASTELFVHLWQTVLPSYLENTLLLGLQVVLLSCVFGVVAAGLVTYTDIKGRKILRWLLMLPLAMPAYVVAYIYTDLFDYAGPVQRLLRRTFDWHSPQDYWFFDIRTLTGASVMLSLVLFPYVYMLSRTAFEAQDQKLMKVAQLAGYGVFNSFTKVVLPLARPAIAISAMLVLMETLADFATVQYFAVNTLTTAIYDTWLGYGDLPAANALGSLLLFFVFLVALAEQRARKNKRHQSTKPNNDIAINRLSLPQQVLATAFCWSLVFAGFVLPFILLIVMAIDYASAEQFSQLISTGVNSLYVAVISATIATLIALILVLYQRLHQDKYRGVPTKIAGLGYAVPGTVIAMAMLATLAPIDHGINYIAASLSFDKPGLILSGTVVAIIFAFVVRFSAIANGAMSSGVEQISRSIDFAPASLGHGYLKTVTKVHVPILASSIWVAWLLVFVEAMKELPAVLLLRPFNFDTLSTQVYQLITNEMLEQGALAAILIVLFGLLPVIWLNKTKDVS